MTRKRQDFYTWLLAMLLVVSQVVFFALWREVSEVLVALAGGLLGLPTIRKVQDAVNEEAEK